MIKGEGYVVSHSSETILWNNFLQKHFFSHLCWFGKCIFFAFLKSLRCFWSNQRRSMTSHCLLESSLCSLLKSKGQDSWKWNSSNIAAGLFFLFFCTSSDESFLVFSFTPSIATDRAVISLLQCTLTDFYLHLSKDSNSVFSSG